MVAASAEVPAGVKIPTVRRTAQKREYLSVHDVVNPFNYVFNFLYYLTEKILPPKRTDKYVIYISNKGN